VVCFSPVDLNEKKICGRFTSQLGCGDSLRDMLQHKMGVFFCSCQPTERVLFHLCVCLSSMITMDLYTMDLYTCVCVYRCGANPKQMSNNYIIPFTHEIELSSIVKKKHPLTAAAPSSFFFHGSHTHTLLPERGHAKYQYI